MSRKPRTGAASGKFQVVRPIPKFLQQLGLAPRSGGGESKDDEEYIGEVGAGGVLHRAHDEDLSGGAIAQAMREYDERKSREIRERLEASGRLSPSHDGRQATKDPAHGVALWSLFVHNVLGQKICPH
eukprot:Rmarinus@m.12316